MHVTFMSSCTLSLKSIYRGQIVLLCGKTLTLRTAAYDITVCVIIIYCLLLMYINHSTVLTTYYENTLSTEKHRAQLWSHCSVIWSSPGCSAGGRYSSWLRCLRCSEFLKSTFLSFCFCHTDSIELFTLVTALCVLGLMEVHHMEVFHISMWC